MNHRSEAAANRQLAESASRTPYPLRRSIPPPARKHFLELLGGWLLYGLGWIVALASLAVWLKGF